MQTLLSKIELYTARRGGRLFGKALYQNYQRISNQAQQCSYCAKIINFASKNK
jgi:hypothetical protein